MENGVRIIFLPNLETSRNCSLIDFKTQAQRFVCGAYVCPGWPGPFFQLRYRESRFPGIERRLGQGLSQTGRDVRLLNGQG